MDQDLATGLLVGQKLIQFLKRDKGYYLDFDGQIKPKHDQEQGILNFPWLYHNTAGRMKCPLWQTLHFGCFNTISQYCIKSCWKLVIIPTSIQKLFWIDEYLNTRSFESKAGLDMRTYTFGMYRAFVYFDNLKDAKTLEATIFHMLDNKKDFDIFVKRGCTEFENKLSSPKWQIGKDQPTFESFLEKIINQGDSGSEIKLQKFHQPEWLKHTIKLYWTQSAYAFGDKSWETTPYAPYIQTSKTPVKY